jgi:hypothetical protein
MHQIRPEDCPAGNGGETTETSAPPIAFELAAAYEAGLIGPETFEWASVKSTDVQLACANGAIKDANEKRDAIARFTQLCASDTPEFGLVPILVKRLSEIHPSPENDELYSPVRDDDPEIIALAESIRKYGIQEPLVITTDNFILSGHRRYAAARLAGLDTVKCRVEDVIHNGHRDEIVKRLREYNRQREKSFDEKMREIAVESDPDEAYTTLVKARRARSRVAAAPMVLVGKIKRSQISPAAGPMMAAIQRVLEERRDFWPLSDRVIHYALLNDPPLRHASKPGSKYRNTHQYYKTLTNLLTRARLEELIPWEAIGDETRPVITWDVHRELSPFVRREVDGFLDGYYRDLMQSQPNHIEITGEKNTVQGILRPLASEFCIPLTLGRGYCSIDPRHEMAERFRKSGKEKLVILLLSDFDPDGQEISQSFAKSMRDDFDIAKIHPVKVALTGEQVQQFELPPMMTAKETSVNYEKFTTEHGNAVFELEALTPQQIQQVLREAIESVLDTDAFNREVEAEKQDALKIAALRTRSKTAFSGVAA